MHIALFSPSWPQGEPPNGIVTYVAWLRKAFLELGHDVSIVSPDVRLQTPDPDVHAIVSRGLDRVKAAVSRRFFSGDKLTFGFGDAIAAEFGRVHVRKPIDVIEMEESFGFAGDVARLTSIPVVVKLHGPAFLHPAEEGGLAPFDMRKIARERDALSQLSALTAPSRFTLEKTLEFANVIPQIAEHIVNPISLPAVTPLWTHQRAGTNNILFVGRFDTVKGGDIVVAAFRLLLGVRPDLQLIFVGPDVGLVRGGGVRVKLADYIAEIGGPALARKISIRGYLPPSEINELRARSLMTVVPSRSESQGYTALEAMLLGCPVVCADSSGLGELVDHEVTGLKARPDDPKDLAAQMQRLLERPTWSGELGRAARAYVMANHSPDLVARQTLDIYRRTIALHRSALPSSSRR